MLVKINKVLESKNKKQYGKTLLGKVIFAAPDVKLEAGSWAVCTSQVQTKTKNEKGELVNIPTEERPILNIVQACFATKELAVAAVIDEQGGDAALVNQMQVIDSSFTLADLKALEKAGV